MFRFQFSVEFSVNRHPLFGVFLLILKLKRKIGRFMECELFKKITKKETRRSDHVLRIIHTNI